MQSAPCPKCGQPTPIGSYCPNDGTHVVTMGSPQSTSGSRQTLGQGVKVGEYVLEEFLGKGGFGEVWSAQHPAIGKQVAVKFLSANALVNYETLARFKREARAVNEIGHENLVDIFSFGELPDGRPYYVMELLRGESLAEYLKRKGPPSFSLLSEVMRQVCNALQAAHNAKVIHRDLKPDNIFLDKKKAPELSVKLLDFGIAKLATAEEEGQSLTRTGIPFGTPAYMSPEQCDGAKNLDHRADIYSLGIVAFEMLTGRNPFQEQGDSALDLLMKHKKNEAPAPSKFVPQRGLTKELDAVVLKALAKKPSDRFDSALAFYEQLKKNLPSKEVAPTQKVALGDAPTMAASSPELTPPGNRAKTVFFAFASAIAVAALAFFLYQKLSAPPTPAPAPTPLSLPTSKPREKHWKARPTSMPNESSPVIASSAKSDSLAIYARDNKPNTAWCEDAPGDGTGEWLALRLPSPTKKSDALKITPKASKEKEKNNSPRELRAELFADSSKLGQQSINCTDTGCEAPISIEGANIIRLIITKVNDENQNRSTCLSEIAIEATP